MSAQPQASATERFTWRDYQSWPDTERWEIIHGRAYAMALAPSTRHQTITGRLLGQMLQRLAGKPCKPFIAPTDVKLSDDDVVQPDLIVICNPARILPSHIEGAPEVVVEVLSPATAAFDQREKKALYERAGVAEYILVDPLEQYAIRFLNGPDGFDRGTVFGAQEMLVFSVLDGLEIPLWEVFELPAPGATLPAGNGPPRT